MTTRWRMPAEWEPQEAVWLAWPHRESSWPGKIEAIGPVYCEIARALAPVVKARILVPNEDIEAQARRMLRANGAEHPNVELWRVPTNDSWVRDYGPIFVLSDDPQPRLGALDFTFNTWGGKYPPYDLDDDAPKTIVPQLGAELIVDDMVLEGGSIEVNGLGTLMTTEACLLNPNRNPGMSKAEIEARLAQRLGVRHFLWLGDGIEGDDTDGHIDDLARFTDARTVVTVVEEDPSRPDHEVLQDNLRRLKSMKDQDGQPLVVKTLPMPEPVIWEGEQLPASYANFLITNGLVLVPTFACPQDERALAVLAECFPGRRVAGIDCRDLVWGLGALHCISQQQPVVPSPGGLAP